MEGKPFVGDAGEILRSTLLRNGIDPDIDCYITNLSLVRATNDKFESIRTTDATRESIGRLKRDIETYRPNCTLLLGNHPLYEIAGKGVLTKEEHVIGITAYRGSILESHCNTKCIATYHPSY